MGVYSLTLALFYYDVLSLGICPKDERVQYWISGLHGIRGEGW